MCNVKKYREEVMEVYCKLVYRRSDGCVMQRIVEKK